MPPSHVLVALDGSPLAEVALAETLELFDCRVTVLNVVTPIDESMSESGILGAGEERRESAHDHAEAVLARVQDRAADADRTVDTAVETGDPAETIVEFAERETVDHVVLGGHSGDRGDISRRLLGTVATTVVSEAPVTVTVVR
jgi:nucleotide-binding universal stress UspA family protein